MTGGGQPVALTNTLEPETCPAWSPDGRWIAFLRRLEPDGAAILVMPAIGGDERKVSEVRGPDARADARLERIRWSPDGKWLLCRYRPVDAEQHALFLLDVHTGQKRRLTSPPPGTEDGAGVFSPAGKQIAFVRIKGNVEIGDIYRSEHRCFICPPGGAKGIDFRWPAELAAGVEDRRR